MNTSIFLYRISKISHYADCYTIGLRRLSCLGLMTVDVCDKLDRYDV